MGMSGCGGGSLHVNGTAGTVRIENGKLFVHNAKGKVVTEVADGKLPDDLRKVAGNHAGAPALGTFNIAVAIKKFVETGHRGDLAMACSFEDSLYNQKVIAAVHSSAP